jgi:hypothetical protein
MSAMLEMRKIEIADLELAAAGEEVTASLPGAVRGEA